MDTVYTQVSEDKPPNSGIPEALKEIPQWMGTRFERRKDGKTDKPPYRVVPKRRIQKADKTDPENWTTYENALAACERGDVDAIGFVYIKGGALFVVDCDGVIDPETGEIRPAADEVIHTMDTYTELSCSGTGVHVVGYGTKPEYAGCKSSKLGIDVEVYDASRFVVMTGNRIGPSASVEARQQELDELCGKLWPKSEKLYSKRPDHPGPVDLEDQELLDRARRSRTGAKFRKLYDLGDTSGYASASEADFSLLNMLIFWTAGDRDRIARLFEASALHRPKDKHRDYVRRSVDNALGNYVGSFYKPRRVEKARQEDPEDPLTPYLKVLLNPSLWRGKRGASAYKAYAGAVIRAAEEGVVDDDGKMRIGCDTRTLAEISGMRQATICESALPHLVQEMKLVSWRRGKGTKAGVLILHNPEKCTNRITKETTHFSDTVCADTGTALKTLRLLIRMRRGYDKSRKLLRLGMPAMFVVIALANHPQRGQTLQELARITGRRKGTLDHPDKRDTPIKRLKAAGIVREVSERVYRLTGEFAARYEQVLEWSGITQVERAQRRQHERDRERRRKNLPTDKQPTPLRGRDEVRRIVERKREEAKRRKVERAEKPAALAEERIKRWVREGMAERFARAAALGEEANQ